MMQLFGIILLGAFTAQIMLFVLSSITRLKWKRDMQCLAFQNFRNKVEADSVTNIRSEISKKGWLGYRDFLVSEKIDEGGGIYSFKLIPLDKRPLPLFYPGQYLTFQLSIASRNKPVVRCYSLSASFNPNFYRVSIKKVLPPFDNTNSIPPGLVSSYFHAEIDPNHVLKVQAPKGEFYLDTNKDGAIVLIAGGVGVTPLLSMVNTLADQKSQREIWFFYGVRDENEHIMKGHFKKLNNILPNLNLRVCYSAGADAMDASMIETRRHTTSSGIETLEFGIAALIRSDTKARYDIKSNLVTIGRSKSSDIIIPSSHLSANHARITVKNSECYLQDLDSKNGTIVNDQTIKSEPVRITDGDIIYFGSRDIKFRCVINHFDNQIPTEIKDKTVTKDPNDYVITKQRITIDLLKSSLPSNNFDFYLCGPASMMNTLTSELKLWGVPKDDIHYENFGPASVAKIRSQSQTGTSAAESNLEVSFANSNKKCKWNPNYPNLLALAEEMGIPIDSGCRAGNCGTCSVRLISGRVSYPTAPGGNVGTDSCLTCVAVPQTDISIEA